MICKFEGPGDRQRLAAQGDVDAREREAVQAAQQRRDEETARRDADDSTIWVGEEDLERVENHGSVLIFTGHDAQGHVVRFAVDHRPADGLVEAVKAEGVLPCYVEAWQVLSRTSAALV